MSKPPSSTPHSDLDGVHRDERPNIETAIEAHQDSGDVAKAKEQSVARPEANDDRPASEDHG